MITVQDMSFHTPADVDHRWGETKYFDIFVPEANIHAWVYLCFRPGVGAVLNDVTIVDGTSGKMLDALYIDTQNHLPIPADMAHFTLPNGLSLDARSGPRDYRVDYVGVNGTELHIEAKGFMEPYDIHDHAIDPLAAKGSVAVENSGFGQAYANHFDLACRVTVTLTVRGKTYAVDCTALMDHSWGPRGERGMRAMCWMNACFSENLVLHGIWSVDLSAAPGAQHDFKHDFAVIEGELRGAVSGRLSTTRPDIFTTHAELELTDFAGRTYLASGVAMTHHHWLPYACCLTPTQMLRWTSPDGRIGYGTVMEGLPLDSCLR